MLGVITRRAVVEGSAPPLEERASFDTVAYTGLVPVKVRQRVSGSGCHTTCVGAAVTGDGIVPSGRNDGSYLSAHPHIGGVGPHDICPGLTAIHRCSYHDIRGRARGVVLSTNAEQVQR
jgi:hypothetical protein